MGSSCKGGQSECVEWGDRSLDQASDGVMYGQM